MQIARMIAKYHQDIQQKEIRAEKEEAQKLKKIANNLAKMVKEFWNNVEKVCQTSHFVLPPHFTVAYAGC